jgi:hypothetical protein
MAKPKPPPPPRPQLRAGDVVVLRQSQEDVEGEIITVLGDGRYKVRWLTGSDYQGRVTTVHDGGGSQEELGESLPSTVSTDITGEVTIGLKSTWTY